MTTTVQTRVSPPINRVCAAGPNAKWVMICVLVGLFAPVAAHAQGTDPNTIAQNIQTFMTGPWGKSIASVAFGCVGLVAWWGYMSWSTAAKAVLGGVCLFSAPWLVQTFFG